MKAILVLAGAVALTLAGSAFAGPTNLIVNGSFEDPAITAGTFKQLPSIPGWTGSDGIEVDSPGSLSPGGTIPDGVQFVELNVESPSTLSQTVTTIPGQKYVLSFDYSARPNSGANDMSVGFTGAPDLAVNGAATSILSFKHFSETVTAGGTSSVVSFTPLASGGLGNLVDNVSLTPVGGGTTVPLPTGLELGLCGLMGGGLLGVARRLRAAR